MKPDVFMENSEIAFFHLLRSGLWGRDVEDLSLFPLSDKEWRHIFDMAVSQTVVALVYDGVCRLPDGLMPTDSILLKWVAMVDGIERRNDVMNRAVKRLADLFSENSLAFVLQKGQGVASFYDRPAARECGDIDIYFPERADDEKAIELLSSKGVKVETMPDGARVYKCMGIDVEQHVRLIDIQNPFLRFYLLTMERKYAFVECDIDGTAVSIPSPVLNLVLLNTHIMKHAMGWGVGLRQLCDMARACHSLHGSYDKEDVRMICHKLGINRWSGMLHGFMVKNLGLDRQLLPYDDVDFSPDILMEIIMSGGNFGMNRSGRTDSSSAAVRKIKTMKSFFKNARTVMKYAPSEGFWTVWDLIKGQLK